jgi:hypothetical protein
MHSILSPHFVRRRLAGALGALALAVGLAASAQTTAPAGTQTLALRAGWNAIALQIDPLAPAPAAVFTNLPVDKVATYFPTRTPVEFIQDVSSLPWKQKGWRAWFAPARPEALVSDLYALSGGQCYLVHATAPATLNLQGTVVNRRPRWRADSYNFVGFPVDPAYPPTFQAWFAGSTAHQSTTRTMIFTLDANDRWAPVTRPESTLIQPGTAYWVYCQGASDYAGPVEVTVPLAVADKGVDFGDVTESVTVRFRNPASTPIGFTLELTPAGALPVYYEQKLLAQGQRLQLPLAAAVSFGPLEAGGEMNLRLTLDRALMTGTNGAAVLSVRDDVGSLIRIPVTGSLP